MLFGCPAEAFTCTFLRGHPHTVLSDADDVVSPRVWQLSRLALLIAIWVSRMPCLQCALKLCDVRLVGQGPGPAPKPTHTIGNSELDAEVTAISAHPAFEHIFAVGSYSGSTTPGALPDPWPKRASAGASRGSSGTRPAGRARSTTAGSC